MLKNTEVGGMPHGPGPSSALKHLYPARARLGTGTLGPPSEVSAELHRLWADQLDLSRKDTESRGISLLTLRVSPVEGAPDRAIGTASTHAPPGDWVSQARDGISRGLAPPGRREATLPRLRG